MKFMQPRPTWTRRPVPDAHRVHPPFPVHHVLYRYPHHAGPSGYDRLCDFVGDQLQISPAMHYAGETVFRPWAILDVRFGGQVEYSRHDWVLERALMKAMRRERGALFHLLYGEKNFRHAWKAAGANGNRLVATLHQPPENYTWRFRSTRHFAHLSHAIVMSEASKDFAEDLVGKGRVSVVPYGVDTEYFEPARPRIDRCPPRLIFAGCHERDFETFAEVVDIVVNGHPDAEFVMVSEHHRCRELSRRFPHRARFTGRVSDEDYRAALQTSDLMVLPLKRSVAVTAVLEAMACGVPVLTTEGGVRDYVAPSAGVLCPVGAPVAMADAAIALLRDRCRLERMKIRAREHALTFAWPLIARRTVDVYRLVMGN
jgi:glycosyltransferase involved in cell wall biosynthesis